MKIPKHAQPEAGQRRDQRHQQHAPARVEAEDHRHEHRHAAVDAGARRDPQRLAGDQLLGVDRRGEDRVVGVLELVLDERRVHGREGAGEQHGGGDDPGADEVDVVVAGDRADQRAEAEAEGEQVDRRVDGRGERRRAPERREVDDLADHHALRARRARGGRARRCAAGGARPSGDLLAGQQDEDVLEVGDAALAVEVGVAVGVQDRRPRCRCGACASRARARCPRPRSSRVGEP